MFIAISKAKLPSSDELSQLTGRVISVREAATRERVRRGNVLVTLEASGVQRELVSYDRALLDGLRPGQISTVGIYAGNGDSEIWSIVADGEFQRTYQDTFSVRASRIQKERRILFFVSCFAAFWLVFARKLGLTRDRE